MHDYNPKLNTLVPLESILKCRITGHERTKPFYVERKTLVEAQARLQKFMSETLVVWRWNLLTTTAYNQTKQVLENITDWDMHTCGIASMLMGPAARRGYTHRVQHKYLGKVPKNVPNPALYLTKRYKYFHTYPMNTMSSRLAIMGYREVPTVKIIQVMNPNEKDLSGVHKVSLKDLEALIITHIIGPFLRNTQLDFKKNKNAELKFDVYDDHIKRLDEVSGEELFLALYKQWAHERGLLGYRDLPDYKYELQIEYYPVVGADCEENWAAEKLPLDKPMLPDLMEFVNLHLGHRQVKDPSLPKDRCFYGDKPEEFHLILIKRVNDELMYSILAEGIEQTMGKGTADVFRSLVMPSGFYF